MWNGVYGKYSNPLVEFYGPGLCDPAGLHAARSCTESATDTIMATQMRMKLPSLKLTQRSTQGIVRHRTVPRGMTSSSALSPGCTDDTEKSSPDRGVARILTKGGKKDYARSARKNFKCRPHPLIKSREIGY